MSEDAINAAIVQRLIDREGGFVNAPFDRGGPTKFGITLLTLRKWRRKVGGIVPDGGADVLEAIKSLTRNEAAAIYDGLFLRRYNLHEIASPELRDHVLDCIVMHGPKRGVRWLQKAVGVTEDGIIGPLTLTAIELEEEEEINNSIISTRILFIVTIVVGDPTQLKFLRGWTKRALEFL